MIFGFALLHGTFFRLFFQDGSAKQTWNTDTPTATQFRITSTLSYMQGKPPILDSLNEFCAKWKRIGGAIVGASLIGKHLEFLTRLTIIIDK